MNEVPSLVKELLYPSVDGVAVALVDTGGGAIRIEAECTVSGVSCPDCGTWSDRVHVSYLRFPADVPSMGQRVVRSLRVRRFLCRDSRVRAGRSSSRCRS